jgi:hypothetical protein
MDTEARHNGRELPGSVRLWTFLIGVGIFATTLAQTDSLALPIRNLLKDELHQPLHRISLFFGIAAFPWYFKIIIGVLSDSIPLFGTVRRYYLVLSATTAGSFWLLAGLVPRSYFSLLMTLTAMEAMLVVGSTVVGGLLVEAGQRLDAAGPLVSARIFVEGSCTIIAGPLAGVLAGLPFGMAAGVAAIIAFTMAPIMLIWLKEPPITKYNVSVVVSAYRALRDLFRSRALWLAAIFLFIASVPETFPSVVWEYQKSVLKLPDHTIGYLQAGGGLGGVMAALTYGSIYRRLHLRSLLAVGILCSAVGSLGYIFYNSLPAAFAIDTANGFLTTMWILAMMEMAVWVTPRRDAAAGFALLMGAVNAGGNLGDYIVSSLVDYHVVTLYGVAVLSAVSTAVTAAALLVLPSELFGPPER